MPELPTIGTPDSCRNSRPSVHLKTMVTELKYVRCRNSRCKPKLPTIGTPDLRRNSRPSRHLKTSRWLLVVHTGHVRYDHHSEFSKVFKLRVIGTPDHCRNFRPSELLTHVGTPDPQGFGKLAVGLWSSIPDTSGMTRTVNPPRQLKCETLELPTLAGTPDLCRNSQ